MTPEVLQKELIKELKVLLKNVDLAGESDKKANFNFFEQVLPRRAGEDDPTPFPWCVVRLEDNVVSDVGVLKQVQEVVVSFGIYYENNDCQYHHTMFTIFEKIKKRFLTKPLLGGFFSALPQIQSFVDNHEEDTYPYYYGAIYLQFMLPNYEREDDFT